jgi:hypothetical protein
MTVTIMAHSRWMTEQTDKYRRNASEARQKADRAIRDDDRESWLAIEKGWLQLVEEAEKKRPVS